MPIAQFEAQLTRPELELWLSLTSPAKIQTFLNETPYSADKFSRCPLRVLRERVAHCFDGALFAVAALRRIGYPPLIVDMLPEPGADDDHVLALYHRDGYIGAVAQSNFVGLRFREVIYRNLRELVLSYFEDYYNVKGEKTLRGYTRPLNLTTLDQTGWLWRDEGVDIIEQRLNQRRSVPLLTPQQAAQLAPVDRLSYEAGMLGVNEAGLYYPAD